MVWGFLLCFQWNKVSMEWHERFEDTKGYSEANRIDNGKRTKTMIYKILQRKQKIEEHQPYKNRGELRWPGSGTSSCSTCDILRITHDTTRPSAILNNWRIVCSTKMLISFILLSYESIKNRKYSLFNRMWSGH